MGRRAANPLDLVQGIELVVEHAGCPSCADRVRRALEEIATVEVVEVDDEADLASVRLESSDLPTEEAVAVALREASSGSGHEYRIRPGSWRVVAA
jgi:copper chaperone CopZ